MDLSQLAMFRAVAEEGSISAAALRLHRVPSNLTARIKQLEADLGVDLFIREKQRLRLSAQGWHFLDYARRLLDLADEARQSITSGTPRGPLALGSLESTAAVRIPPVLAEYHRRFPEVLLDLSTGPSGELIDGVLAGRLAGALVDGPVAHPSLDEVAVFDEELVLISAIDHPPITRARDVNGRNIYAFRPNCSYRRLFEAWFRKDDSAPGKVFETESYHGMLACVSAGAGLALLPRSMLESMPFSNSVQAHELDAADGRISIHLIWRRGLRLPSLSALLEILTATEAPGFS
jgi:DNA-binding transcriptional LysR family regulator